MLLCSLRRCFVWLGILALCGHTLRSPAQGLDLNRDGLDDVWQWVFEATGLQPGADADGDGYTNAQESLAGTNPFDPLSHPGLLPPLVAAGYLQFPLVTVAGKHYTLETRPSLTSSTWLPATEMDAPADGQRVLEFPVQGETGFFRLRVTDLDSDGDGITDADERWLGLDPHSPRSDRGDAVDDDTVRSAWGAANVVTLGTLDAHLSERWPEPGLIAVRRQGGLDPIHVSIALGGTATPGIDYLVTPGTNITLGAGIREAWIEIHPLADILDLEPDETIVVSLLPGAGYTRGATTSATVVLENEPAGSLPHAKEAARFLLQAAFGPDQDDPGDADDIPENVETVMSMGFGPWIEDQFSRPPGYVQPWVDWAIQNAPGLQLYGNWKEHSWWARVMGAPRLRPDAAETVAPDPLRQRVAFALSEILVTSDRPEQLAVEQAGMANYYDLMVRHAFGNYRDLLRDVALHPAMGIFLSHLGNRKADPVRNVYPDENFAREIMQLFTIGLWELNPDGTRRTDAEGRFIPTYSNRDITELARVFTGLSFGNNTLFDLYPRDFTVPMKMWDAEHDLGPKKLLGGLALPARTASPGNTGLAGMADVEAAVSNLFAHPNVGPFVGRQLIQRLVTSNPSTNYVRRVAAAFADNGAGVRGDMKAVVKAILLDPEARDPSMLAQPTWGKLREPLLRVVNYARAFNASSPSGYYPLSLFTLDHGQDPMDAPSVFNFFLPGYSPPGPITRLGLVAPEFQLLNASSAITGPNYFWNSIVGDLHRYGTANPDYAVRLNLAPELAMIVPAGQIAQDVPAGPAADPDPLLRRLDLALTGGTLSPRQLQIIREAMLRVGPPSWQWHRERLRLAIYLIVTSAEFNVLL
jgi:uncharacterized protein (DUF1800 family)